MGTNPTLCRNAISIAAEPACKHLKGTHDLSDFYLRRGGISHTPLCDVPAWTTERSESFWRR
jgi:hypothetical protein